jgi:NADH:ubiquinone oxidoreductase subunit B-like Fe-S oxidoreductase
MESNMQKSAIDLSDIQEDTPQSRLTIEQRLRNWARIKSPWAIHYNSGSCNGCDIELLTLVTPRYDVERFGVKLQGSPRHADILIVTGSVTFQSKDRLLLRRSRRRQQCHSGRRVRPRLPAQTGSNDQWAACPA